MSSPKKVSALARLNEITTTPHPVTPTPPGTGEGTVRYTAVVPKHLHRSLKQFALDNDTSTFALTKALFFLLAEDEDVQKKVRGVITNE